MLAAGGLFAAQDEARGIGLGYQFAVFVGDAAFDIADGATALDDVAFSAQFGDANGTQEIDFEFDSGERFAWREGAGESDAHGGVGDVAKYAAMNGTHRIEVLGADLQEHHGAAVAGFQQLEADQFAYRRGDAIGNVARIGTDGRGFIRHGWFLPGSRRLDAANAKESA